MEEKVKKIMAEIFVCSPEKIDINTNKHDIDNWDSLQHLLFISRLEEEFHVNITPVEIDSIVDLESAVNILRKKIGN
ncbi:MAG: acyl carrier protein [Saprospiraceae bacterium]|nr:acyl carrier protein [Saprospiraceae bacterium]